MGDREQPSASESVKNIILVGRTGNGKSTTGNSLIGKEVFISETAECQTCKVKTPDGLIINVIDTPDYMNKEISNCLTLSEGGIHAVVLVLSVRTKITQEEESAVSTLQLLFGSKIVDYMVVLFTGGDVLEKESKTLDDYLSRGCPEFLKTILILCGGRRVLFDNKTSDEVKKVEQVKQLLAHVAAIGKSNGGETFTEEIHVKIEPKEVESTNPEETELEKLKKQLEMSHGQTMNMMAQMVENMLKQSSASQERMIQEMREKLEKSHQENEYVQNEKKAKCNIL